MKCQLCNKNNATIHYKSSINGKTKEMFLCSECAEKNNISANKGYFEPVDMFENFFGSEADDIFGGMFAGMLNEKGTKQGYESSSCPFCNMKLSEFLHRGRLGCSECYKTFENALKPTLKRIHANVEHCGKVPESQMKKQSIAKKIEALRKKLSEAIETQEFELAAKYRDEIKELENTKQNDEGRVD